jgi:hypothetical protein
LRPGERVICGIRQVKYEWTPCFHASRKELTRPAAVGMAVYTAKAMLHGKGNDVREMPVENVS